MYLEKLRKLGISEGEIKVYDSILNLGRCSINEIHEKVRIERRNIYDILNKLIERGLITYVYENKRRFFQISHPNKIFSYIDEKKNHLEDIKKDLEGELPSMIEKFNSKRVDINSEIFRGAEGIKAVWVDMLNSKEIYWIGSGRYVPKKFPLFFSNWNKKRIKMKIKMFNLLRNEMREQIKVFSFEEVRFLPKEFSGNPTVICIYGNKIANLIYGDELFAFVIENKELAENYKGYHNYLWKNVAKDCK